MIGTPRILPLRIVLAVFAFIIGANFCFVQTFWHSNATFYFVNILGAPWWVYGGLFILAAVLLLFEKTRPWGYLIGVILYTFFSIAAWLAIIGSLHWSIIPAWLALPAGKVGNIFAASNITTIAILYWSSLRWSIYDLVDPERRAE